MNEIHQETFKPIDENWQLKARRAYQDPKNWCGSSYIGPVFAPPDPVVEAAVEAAIESAKDLAPPPPPPAEPGVDELKKLMTFLDGAIEDKTPIQFTYVNKNGEISDRTALPTAIYSDAVKAVEGIDTKTFKLANMSNVKHAQTQVK